MDLQEEYELTFLFIAHNMSVVEHVSNNVAVMYLGKLVELADRDSLFQEPLHPYTQALIAAIPLPDPTIDQKQILLHGEVPSSLHPPSGCRFHPRCPEAMDICSQSSPEFKEVSSNHWASCWLRE